MTTTTDLMLTERIDVLATTAVKLSESVAAEVRRGSARARDQVELVAHAERQRREDGERRAGINKDVQASLDEIFRGKKKP